MRTEFGVYVHFPYCLSKCPYCDFASRAEQVIPQERYTEAVLRELRARAVAFPDREAIWSWPGLQEWVAAARAETLRAKFHED